MTRKQHTALISGAYQDGIDDYCAGVPLQLCPYKRRCFKSAWRKGWMHMDHKAMRELDICAQLDLFIPYGWRIIDTSVHHVS